LPIGKSFSTNVHGCDVSSDDSPCGRTLYMWTNSLQVDVPCRAISEVKDFVKTYARPEASMAKGYAMSEILGYCTEYMQRFGGTPYRMTCVG
jgi:hypothetical protein